MKEIGKAIQKYKEDNGDIPNWLSDLYPKYLQDPNILLCPADTSEPPGSKTLRSEPHDPKMACSYRYQFSSIQKSAVRSLEGGDEQTYRDWKLEQLKEFGDKVPIVRCWWHGDRALNLSYGGEVYESSINWEFDLKCK